MYLHIDRYFSVPKDLCTIVWNGIFPLQIMSESTQPTPPAAKATDPSTFQEVLKVLTGQIVTVANPESYEEAPLGHRLTTGFYKARILKVGDDFVSLATEFKHTKGEIPKEPVKQFVPLHSIKRISVMKSEKVIHL